MLNLDRWFSQCSSAVVFGDQTDNKIVAQIWSNNPTILFDQDLVAEEWEGNDWEWRRVYRGE